MKMNKKAILLMLVMAVALFGAGQMAHAVEDAVGVAGCASIAVDPSTSLEFQQGVCNAGENDPATSCGASGHGTCSSPKMNDTMPDAGHCICISETTEEVLAV